MGWVLDGGLVEAALFFAVVVVLQIFVSRWNLPRETRRRWQHAVTGQAFVLISYHLPIALAVPALLLGAGGIWYARTYKTERFMEIFGPLLRPSEQEEGTLPGAFYFLLGTALTAGLFPLETARYAVSCLALADPVAAWAGSSIPSPRIHQTASVAGCAGCFGMAYCLGWVFLYDASDAHLSRLRIMVGALACATAEAVPVVNDNLIIPLATACAVQVLR